MKKELKKILCGVLSFILVFCATPVVSTVSANAAEQANELVLLSSTQSDDDTQASCFDSLSSAVSDILNKALHFLSELCQRIKCLFTNEEYVEISKTSFECSRDGLTIRGTEYRPDGENLPIAVVSHGFMANSETVVQYAKLLARMGYAAYCFDFCGGCVLMGKSDGETTEMSVITETEDLKAVIDYAASLSYTDESNITLMGCSQGGFVSSLVAAELDEKISNLVLFYPAFSIPDDARKGKMMFAEFDPENIPETIYCGPMKLGKCYVADVIDMDPFAEIVSYSGDVLIVHGTDDSIVDLSYAERAYEAYNSRAGEGRTVFKIIDGAGHMFMSKYDKIAQNYLKDFLM